eukprot:492819_1
MAVDTCDIAGDVGIVVQISLAVLVGFVLLIEYFIEFLKSLCTTHSRRSFRSFWFDSYKICAGALVSHIFNITVSIAIDKLSTNADQCAIYALAFYYEACGVPFVQLLQYGVIQYALKMAYPSQNNQSTIDRDCRTRWQWISKPGIYDENRYPVNDCLHCRACQDRSARCSYLKIAFVIILALTASFLSAYFGYTVYDTAWYVDVSMGFLVLIFLFTTAIAPVSSLWQTVQWVVVKLFEKTLWSVFALSQASVFAKWSRVMSTGDPTLDAWLYIAIVPIIMNAFMFFMFSRISRLKLPCFRPKYTDTIEKERVRLESKHAIHSAPMLEMSDEEMNAKFDKKEAFKVGIVFMLMINVSLLVIATSYLCYKGAIHSIWILFLSMLVVPTICSVITIYAFAYFVDRGIHVCPCCVDRKNLNRDRQMGGSIQEDLVIAPAHQAHGLMMGLDELNSRKI